MKSIAYHLSRVGSLLVSAFRYQSAIEEEDLKTKEKVRPDSYDDPKDV